MTKDQTPEKQEWVVTVSPGSCWAVTHGIFDTYDEAVAWIRANGWHPSECETRPIERISEQQERMADQRYAASVALCAQQKDEIEALKAARDTAEAQRDEARTTVATLTRKVDSLRALARPSKDDDRWRMVDLALTTKDLATPGARLSAISAIVNSRKPNTANDIARTREVLAALAREADPAPPTQEGV